MSSILDALKKAERESTTDRGAGAPWPAPISAPSPFLPRTRRWWVLLGLVVGLCVSGVVFWQVGQYEITRTGESTATFPPSPSNKPNQRQPTSVVELPKPNVPVGEPQQLPARTLADASPQRSAQQAPAPIATAPSFQPEKKPLRAAVQTSDPVHAPSGDQNRRPADSPKASEQPLATPPETKKFFRRDPRIDLQALVWAPESAARFVVINNRLIKEGGSVDNIVVVQINPDDVLLAEGSDRWHEAFNIR